MSGRIWNLCGEGLCCWKPPHSVSEFWFPSLLTSHLCLCPSELSTQHSRRPLWDVSGWFPWQQQRWRRGSILLQLSLSTQGPLQQVSANNYFLYFIFLTFLIPLWWLCLFYASVLPRVVCRELTRCSVCVCLDMLDRTVRGDLSLRTEKHLNLMNNSCCWSYIHSTIFCVSLPQVCSWFLWKPHGSGQQVSAVWLPRQHRSQHALHRLSSLDRRVSELHAQHSRTALWDLCSWLLRWRRRCQKLHQWVQTQATVIHLIKYFFDYYFIHSGDNE